MAAYDLKGKRFGKLIAIQIAKKDDSGHNYWQCQCDCGTTIIVRATELINGSVTMCKDCKRKNKNQINVVSNTTNNTGNSYGKNVLNYDREYDNITEVFDNTILNTPIICSVVHAINADLTYAPMIKDEDENYKDSLAEEFNTYFKIREQLDELDVLDWNVGEVIYTAPVYSLLTKQDRYDKVTYEAVEKCLINLKNTALNNGTFYLAFPKICCGRDKLEWKHVKSLIKKVFGDTDFEILLFE